MKAASSIPEQSKGKGQEARAQAKGERSGARPVSYGHSLLEGAVEHQSNDVPGTCVYAWTGVCMGRVSAVCPWVSIRVRTSNSYLSSYRTGKDRGRSPLALDSQPGCSSDTRKMLSKSFSLPRPVSLWMRDM